MIVTRQLHFAVVSCVQNLGLPLEGLTGFLLLFPFFGFAGGPPGQWAKYQQLGSSTGPLPWVIKETTQEIMLPTNFGQNNPRSYGAWNIGQSPYRSSRFTVMNPRPPLLPFLFFFFFVSSISPFQPFQSSTNNRGACFLGGSHPSP